MTQQELLFFDALPGMLPVYAQLRERILAACPGTQVRVSKTQISFRGRYLFAMVSLPRRRMKTPQEEHIIVSFGLGYEVQSERIFATAQPAPRRRTHHVAVHNAADADDELMGWIVEAYGFAQNK